MARIDFFMNWEEPPPPNKGSGFVRETRRSQYEWLLHLLPLMQRPGEWAEVARSWSGGHLSAIASGLIGTPSTLTPQGKPRMWTKLGRWEACTRQYVDKGYNSLYVRYLGPPDATDGEDI